MVSVALYLQLILTVLSIVLVCLQIWHLHRNE